MSAPPRILPHMSTPPDDIPAEEENDQAVVFYTPEEYQAMLAEREILQEEQVLKDLSPRNIKKQFLTAFEMVGGIPRMALWANDPRNYGEFLKMYSRMAPKEDEHKDDGGLVIEHVIPRTDLDA